MDPTLKSRTIAAIKSEIGHLSPQLRQAAKYVVDHQGAFGLDPIRDTARKAGVSTYTLVNMAKRFGFDSFEALREPFRHALIATTQTTADTAWEADMRAAGPQGVVIADAAKNAQTIVAHTLERQNLEAFEAVIDTLTGARTVYLTAVRSSFSMAYYLHYVGRMALPSLELIPRHMNSAIDDLNDAGPGDVMIAITITPYSRETMRACEFAKKKGVKLVLITDSEVVSPRLDPEHTLVASVLSTHDFACFSGMMAMIETLIALLVHRGQDTARARIKSYETLRRENNAFWIAQKKH